MKYRFLICSAIVCFVLVGIPSCKDQAEAPFVAPLPDNTVRQGWWEPQMKAEEKRRGSYYYTAVWYKRTIGRPMLVTYRSENFTDHSFNVPNNIKTPTLKLNKSSLLYPEKSINTGDIIVTWSGKVYTVVNTTIHDIVLNTPFDPSDDSSPFLCISNGATKRVTISFEGD